MVGDCSVILALHPKRERDIDNIFKCLFDSFTHALVYLDDKQIKMQHAEKFDVNKNDGYIDVTVIERFTSVNDLIRNLLLQAT